MTKRNEAVQFTTVAKVLLISLFLGGSGVGYVLQKSQIRTLQFERDKHAKAIEQLENDVRRLDAELTRATSKEQILESLQYHQIQLQFAEWNNIITVPEPSLPGRRGQLRIARGDL